MPLNPVQVQYQLAELGRRVGVEETAVQALEGRVSALENEAPAPADTSWVAPLAALADRLGVLEAILLNVPATRLLGRHAATAGAAQAIAVGTGLALSGGVLVNTGGGGGGSSGWSSGFSSGFS